MGNLLGCIREMSARSNEGQREILSKIQENTLAPEKLDLPNEEHSSAIDSILKELNAERDGILSQIQSSGVKMTGSKKVKIQTKIEELTGAIEDPATIAPDRIRYERELERILDRQLNKDSDVKGASLDTALGTTKSDWKKVTKGGVEVYKQNNAIIQKLGDRKWLAAKVDEFGEFHSQGFFKSMEDSKAALKSNTHSNDFYKKSEAERNPLTPEQKKLVESVQVDKFGDMVVNSVPQVKGDPEAKGVAIEALTDAARKFNVEKAAKSKAAFSTFAFKTAKGKVLDYYKKRSEIQAREVSSNTIDDGEGSTTETKIENVSDRDIKAAPKVELKKEVETKEKPSPVKKVELSEKEKATLMERYQKKKAAEAVIEKTKILEKEEKAKESSVEEKEVDEAPKSVVIKKAPSSFLETAPKEMPEHVVKANEILKRVKGDTFEAIRVASYIPNTKMKLDVVAHLKTIKSDTIGGILKQALVGLDKKSGTYKLATFLNNLVVRGGKGGIRIVIDPSLTSEYFDSSGKGTVYLRDTTTDRITLHEVVHAITSRELAVNKELRGKVLEVMSLVEKAVISDKSIKISAADIKKMRESGNTSASFIKTFGYEAFEGDRGVLYALLNEKEFLAQAMNDSRFQEVLKGMDAPKGSQFKTMWDYIVDLVRSVFGVSEKDSHMLNEVFNLIAETSQVDLSYGNVATLAEIDGMMTGEATLLPNKDRLLDAQFRAFKGEDLEAIRKDTGWFKDKDGSWKYEISDSGAILNMNIKDLDTYDIFSDYEKGVYKLEDILSHNKLYEAYPELRDIRVEIVEESERGEDVAGHFNPSDNSITMVKNAPQNVDHLETLLHELQHVIQFKEDFATGGDLETVRLTKVTDHMQSVYEGVIKNSKKPETKMRAEAKLDIIKSVKENQTRLDKLYSILEDFTEEDTKQVSARREVNNIIGNERILNDVVYDVYHLMLGEAEARNTGKRMKYGAKKLKQESPYSTMDVGSAENLIVHRDSVDMADRVRPSTREEVLSVLESNDHNATIFQKLDNKLRKDFPGFMKDALVGVTDRLREISPKLATYQRRFEFEVVKFNSDYHKKASGFITKYKKLSRDKQLLLDYYLLNDYPQDVEERWKLLKENNMIKEYESAIEVLQDIHKRKQKVALGEYESTPDYWPRRVHDLTALMQSIAEDPTYGAIEAELNKAGLKEADREKAIQQMIHTGKYPALALLKPGSEKGRTIKRVSKDWVHHYKSSVDSLIDHIYESNEAVAARNMFGDVARQNLVSKRDELYSKLNGLEDEDKRTKIVSEISFIENKLNNYEEEWKDGIATMLSKEGHKFDAVQQQEIISLIRGRLLQKGMHGLPALVRNISIATAMGGGMSALTQLADIIAPLHAFGLKHTAGSMFGNRVIKPEDLDLSHTMKDFQTGGSAKYLDMVLTATGVKFMDIYGKTVFMNAAISKAKSMSKKEFSEKWSNILGKETDAVWDEIQSGKVSDLTRFFAFNALSEYQPVSISEMPLAYQQAGNWRVVYALKSFNIKAVNNIRNRVWVNARSAKTPQERMSAIGDGLLLVALLVAAGASVDELKDFILGRDTEFSDNVANNMLKIGLMNKFMLEKGDQRGMVKTILSDTLLPPTKLGDDVYTDIRNLVDGDPTTKKSINFLKSVPWGNLVYHGVSDTPSKNNASMIKDRISRDAKAGASMSDMRDDITKYNRWARGAGEKLITYDTIKKMKKREKDKIKKALAES